MSCTSAGTQVYIYLCVWFCTAGTTAGQDLNLSLDRVNSNRNFTNKLWNAGKFILFQLENVLAAEWQQLAAADFSSSSSWCNLALSDRWIISSLHQVCLKNEDTNPQCFYALPFAVAVHSTAEPWQTWKVIISGGGCCQWLHSPRTRPLICVNDPALCMVLVCVT